MPFSMVTRFETRRMLFWSPAAIVPSSVASHAIDHTVPGGATAAREADEIVAIVAFAPGLVMGPGAVASTLLFGTLSTSLSKRTAVRHGLRSTRTTGSAPGVIVT